MWRPLRASRAPTLLILPLALWSAVPGIQWCPLGWAEVRAECFASCAAAAPSPAARQASCATAHTSCAAPATLEIGSPGCCERACEAPEPDGSASAPEYPGGRAYCFGGPSGGDGISPNGTVILDASGPAAVLPITDALVSPPEITSGPTHPPPAHPPAPPGGAVPRTRAPPPVGTTTC